MSKEKFFSFNTFLEYLCKYQNDIIFFSKLHKDLYNDILESIIELMNKIILLNKMKIWQSRKTSSSK